MASPLLLRCAAAVLALAQLVTATAQAPPAAAALSPFELVLGLKLRNLPQLERLFWDIADPRHDKYLQHLTTQQLRDMVGATAEDEQEANAWLLAQGAASVRTSALRDTVTAVFASESAISTAHRTLWKRNRANVLLPPRNNHTRPLDFILRRDHGTAGAPVSRSKPATKTRADRLKRTRYNVASQKQAYQMPSSLTATNPSTLQMVWGPGTFGYGLGGLELWKETQCPLLNINKVKTDGFKGKAGGDNYGEGTLDTHMIASFGLNVSTLVSNTNTSMSTEEGNGFGQAFLDFVTQLAARPTLPQVLSLSLGSLSAMSCTKLCTEVARAGGHTLDECNDFLQQQRQVCMFISAEQVSRINFGLQVLGVRGVSVFGSSGDGGSHWSFQPFSSVTAVGRALNKVGCEFQFPIFPSPSPFMVSIGGTQWTDDEPTGKPIMWSGSGGGFSWQFTRPDHQNKTVDQYLLSTAALPDAKSFNAKGRAYPDISAVAVEGTSESSPTMAGIFSMIMDHRLNNGLKPLGFVGTRIWQTAESFTGEAFEDIVTGNSKTSCATGFPATKGWDPTTGWGRPIWPGMLKHFGSD